MTRRMGCPDDALLLRSREWDAVSPAERREVATHVTKCAACRATLDTTDALFAEYGALFASVQVDSTDTWWASLRSAQHRRTQARLPSASAGMRRWLPATAVVPLLTVAWLLAPSTAVLEADALMARALAAEARRGPDRPPSARWRLCSAAPGAAETTADGPPSGLSTEVPTELVAPLRVVLDGQPLALQFGSVAHFAAWRAAGPHRDEVIVRPTEGIVVLRTTRTTGPLREAALTFARDTYAIVRETFVWPGRGRLDWEPRPVIVPPPMRAVTAPPPGTLDAADVAARLALVETTLAPGDGVQVRRLADRIRVTGVVQSALTRRTLAQLAGNPRIVVDVRPAPAAAAPPTPLARAAAVVTQQLTALEEVARQYPASAQAQLPPDTRAQLEQLVQQHYQTLGPALDALGAEVDRLDGRDPKPRPSAPRQPPTDWASRAKRAATTATRLHAAVLASQTLDATTAVAPQPRDGVTEMFDSLWNLLMQRTGHSPE